MSETTNKSAAAKAKSTGATTKTVAKGATEQATETKPDAAVTDAATNQTAENKPTESTPEILSTGEADKLEQSDAEKADSKTEGDKNVGSNQESIVVGGVSSGVGDGAIGDDAAKDSAINDFGITSDSVGTSNPAQLGEVFKGAFVVTAKSDAGFWRSGRKFKRLEKTLVLVLDEDESGIDDVEIVGYESAQVVCLSAEKARRIYNEKNLVVTDIDLDELKVK